MKALVSGAWRDISAGKVRVDGAWRNITRISGKVGGAWKDFAIFAPPVTVSIAPSYAVATDTNLGPSTITTNPVVAIPTGGASPFTYVWTGGTTATAPSSATTAFSRAIGVGEYETETWTVTVTDSLGQTGTASIVAEFYGFEGGI